MDYGSLRQEGIRHLERMAGGEWTDFNVHDPGITILEQLCYALTDLGYRIAHEVPDLLASGGRDPYESLYPPAEILACRPVTLRDLRKLVLDVHGVRNAWIEPLGREASAALEVLHYHPGRRELSPEEDPPVSEPVTLCGLYRVLIETSGLAGVDGTAVRANVARRLHENRGLCEDFAEIRVLEPQMVRLEATVEIAPVEDAGQLLHEIFKRLDDHVSPPVVFQSLDELFAAGTPIDEIFDGPRLDKGFLDSEALDQATRRTSLRTSDLVHVMMDVPGVRAVRDVSVTTGERTEVWFLELDPERVPKLDLAGSSIRLTRGGIAAAVDVAMVIAMHTEHCRQAPTAAAADPGTFAPPPGRDRHVGEYGSLRHQFPAAYGIGAVGLPESADPQRKARARQLEAYLAFFDQLLAKGFAQLAHAVDLFSHGGEGLATYFSQVAESPEEIRVRGADSHRTRLAEMTENPYGPSGKAPSLERKNRFLNHLLARFAEQLTDYSLVLPGAMPPGSSLAPGEKLARDKQAFLERYPRISSARGTAMNALEPRNAPWEPGYDPSRPANVSGLEERLRLRLGLEAELGEEFFLVEHVLLRPMRGGDEDQDVALLAASPYPDPYSSQLSFVFPQAPERFRNPAFRRFIEETLRLETPAHLTFYVHWLEPDAWSELSDAHREWLRRRRQYLAKTLGLAST